jgi:hypothetical protein
MLARRQRLARDLMAHMRRRADRDRVEIGQRGVEFARCLEGGNAGRPQAALADDPDKLEIRVLRDDGQMLILRDLADADDGDLRGRHAACSLMCPGEIG